MEEARATAEMNWTAQRYLWAAFEYFFENFCFCTKNGYINLEKIGMNEMKIHVRKK